MTVENYNNNNFFCWEIACKDLQLIRDELNVGFLSDLFVEIKRWKIWMLSEAAVLKLTLAMKISKYSKSHRINSSLNEQKSMSKPTKVEHKVLKHLVKKSRQNRKYLRYLKLRITYDMHTLKWKIQKINKKFNLN